MLETEHQKVSVEWREAGSERVRRIHQLYAWSLRFCCEPLIDRGVLFIDTRGNHILHAALSILRAQRLRKDWRNKVWGAQRAAHSSFGVGKWGKWRFVWNFTHECLTRFSLFVVRYAKTIRSSSFGRELWRCHLLELPWPEFYESVRSKCPRTRRVNKSHFNKFFCIKRTRFSTCNCPVVFQDCMFVHTGGWEMTTCFQCVLRE